MNDDSVAFVELLAFYHWVQNSTNIDRAEADLWEQAEKDGTREVSHKALDRAVINLYLKEHAT